LVPTSTPSRVPVQLYPSTGTGTCRDAYDTIVHYPVPGYLYPNSLIGNTKIVGGIQDL